jgi:pyrimidine deaminase RibD-like protein
LLRQFVPKNPEVVCHHVTVDFRARTGSVLPDAVTHAEVVGYAYEDGLEALIVSVNGSTDRPDGGTFHVTLSLDRSKGKKPAHSNDLVKSGYEKVSFPVYLTPAFLSK